MPLKVGACLGSYSVVRFLGAGGMGEVYQARDTRLGRDVALKVLPSAVAHNEERLARFKREAQMLAALNHPHIGSIYGLEESDQMHALVLELVEGETLEERIQAGLPLSEAFSIARQIAEALEAAHHGGIIHRDLKPANIKITHAGSVKVLDFGLAKAYRGDRSEGRAANPPTVTGVETCAGSILGTAAYMSPEQARGGPLDKRTDIWAFGCVLYEMLAGRAAFASDSASDTIVAVLSRDPDWHALPGTVPPGVRLMLKRCLQKDQTLRMRDIADARFQMEEAFTAQGSVAQPRRPASVWRQYGGWVVGALGVIVGTIAIMASARRSPAAMPEMRLQVVASAAADPYSMAISPDGRSIVFEARTGRQSQLWLRRLDSEERLPLPGTERAAFPFWSPTSDSVGFFADGLVKRIDLPGGFVRSVASAPSPRRGAWSSDGTILFGASAGPLYRVAATGGAVTQATSLLPGQTNHRHPAFLPGGRRFLMQALGSPPVRGVYLGSLDDHDVRPVVDGESAFTLMPGPYLVLARQGGLWAQKLDRESLQIEGEPAPIAARVLVHPTRNGLGALSSSTVGSIAYRPSAEGRQLVWLDRSGRQVGVVGPSDETQPMAVRLSPDGQTIAVQRMVTGNTDIWLVDAARGVPRRLTLDPAIEGDPIFSPDGKRVVFVSDRKANMWDVYERPADGSGTETLLLESGENKNPRDWSSDGRYVLYASQSQKTGFDIWALPLMGERTPVAVAQTRFSEADARFSTDGRWVAFESDESGRHEIYLQPFPGPGAKLQVSTEGGRAPRWAGSGRELFYVGPDDRLMAVTFEARGSGLHGTAPRGLFMLPETERVGPYEPSHDGQRFLVNSIVSDSSPITIILNWTLPRR